MVDEKQPPPFLTLINDTATDTVTELVNIKREGNILQDAILLSYRSCLCIQSIVLTAKGGSAVIRRYFRCLLCVFGKNSMQHLSEKTNFPIYLDEVGK